MENLYTNIPDVERITTGYDLYLPGYGVWRARGTSDWLLLHTASGKGRFGHGKEQLTINVNDLILVRPGTLHDYGLADLNGRWGQLWFHFHPRPHWHDLLCWPEAAPGVMRLRLAESIVREKIVANLWEAQRLYASGLRRREFFALNALETSLLWCDTQNPLTGRLSLDGRILAVMDYLCQNLSASATPEDLSRIGGLSASRIAHLFRLQIGMPPARFHDNQRLIYAKSLLEQGGYSVSAIAAQLGMDPPYFSHWFKRHASLSPRDYRQRHQQNCIKDCMDPAAS